MNPREDLRPIGQEDRGYQAWFKPVVAVTVNPLMEFIGGDRGEWTILVGQSSAIGVAVGTIGATVAAEEAGHRTARVGEVAAAATRGRAITLKIIAVGKIAVVLGVVLARRDQRTELEAVEDRRFIPNRVGHSEIELGAVVSARVSHDRIIIPERSRERVHRGRAFLVGRIGLAGLD